MVNITPAAADPCAALFGQMKTDCENFGKSGNNPLAPGNTSGGTSIFDLFTNPIKFVGGIRHVFLRIAEVVIGGILVVVGFNALVKAQTGVNVTGSTTKLVKKAVKV